MLWNRYVKDCLPRPYFGVVIQSITTSTGANALVGRLTWVHTSDPMAMSCDGVHSRPSGTPSGRGKGCSMRKIYAFGAVAALAVMTGLGGCSVKDNSGSTSTGGKQEISFLTFESPNLTPQYWDAAI